MAKLLYKLQITGKIKVKTGLHIGGSEVDLDIGGIDKEVIKVKDGDDKVPYIPGSSLKGKLRNLIARKKGYEHISFKESEKEVFRNKKADKNAYEDWDHNYAALLFSGSPFRKKLKDKKDRNDRHKTIGFFEDEKFVNVIKVNGVEKKLSKNSRLIIRDSYIQKGLISKDNTYLEDKAENTITRSTGKANPRHLQRVSKDAIFDMDMILDIYEGDEEVKLLETLDLGFQLLQKDYLGGSGTRGYGQVSIFSMGIQKLVFMDNGTINKDQPVDYTFKVNDENDENDEEE